MRHIEWSDKQRQILSAPYKHCLEVEEGTPRSGKTTCQAIMGTRVKVVYGELQKLL